jgi:PTH1 family peptidyl-tRNA hydrolase
MLKWISNIFSSKQKRDNTDCMNKFLIVGLGNIGAEYVNTRHNIGFKILDYFAKKETIFKLGAPEYKFKGRTFSF